MPAVPHLRIPGPLRGPRLVSGHRVGRWFDSRENEGVVRRSRRSARTSANTSRVCKRPRTAASILHRSGHIRRPIRRDALV